MKYKFVDKIVDLNTGLNIQCQYTWPEELEIYNDHFPDFPVVPGVWLTEMMGQSAALCIQSQYAEFGTPMLIQISNARFRNWVRPGDMLDTYADVLSVKEKLAGVKVKTEKNATLIATSELLFTFEENNKLGLPDVDPVLAAYLSQSNN